MMIKKNLFAEANEVLSKAAVMAVSPYTAELAPKLSVIPTDIKEIVDTIIKISGEQETNVESSAGKQPGFFSFRNAVDEALKKIKPPVFGDYITDTTKLASLIAYAYYLASKKDKTEPDKESPKVYHSFDIAQQIARNIVKRMTNDLQMGYIFTKHPEFKKSVMVATCSAVFQEKDKDKSGEETAFKMPEPKQPK